MLLLVQQTKQTNIIITLTQQPKKCTIKSCLYQPLQAVTTHKSTMPPSVDDVNKFRSKLEALLRLVSHFLHFGWGPNFPISISHTRNPFERWETKNDRVNLHPSALNAHPLKTSVPAATPPAIYFTWDFVERTKDMLSAINIDALVNNDAAANEAYLDCVGRSFLINMIIHDETGKADLMLGGPRVDFGAEVKACASALSPRSN